MVKLHQSSDKIEIFGRSGSNPSCVQEYAMPGIRPNSAGRTLPLLRGCVTRFFILKIIFVSCNTKYKKLQQIMGRETTAIHPNGGILTEGLFTEDAFHFSRLQ
jgi:hypothetical protein